MHKFSDIFLRLACLCFLLALPVAAMAQVAGTSAHPSRCVRHFRPPFATVGFFGTQKVPRLEKVESVP
jgi:hypothetical protein